MEDLFEARRGDYCTKCNSERTIECYNVFNKPLNYSIFLDKIEKGDNNVIQKLDNTEISYMMCRRCRERYFIDWTSGIPMPVRDIILMNIVLENSLK